MDTFCGHLFHLRLILAQVGFAPNGDQGTIIIAHGNGYYTVYLHMEPPLNVSVGDNVTTGDTLGFAGNTGCAINVHLHFEIRKDNWFFDTELLLLASKAGYRIKEIPVYWEDDPDTRVNIVSTAWEDLKGLLRLRFKGRRTPPSTA